MIAFPSSPPSGIRNEIGASNYINEQRLADFCVAAYVRLPFYPVVLAMRLLAGAMVVAPMPEPPIMQLHVLSDLHTAFADFDLPEIGADVVVLAGDVGVGKGGLECLLKQRLDKPVIYVPGNHEFYGHDISLVGRLRSDAPSDVHVLDNQSVISRTFDSSAASSGRTSSSSERSISVSRSSGHANV